MRLLFYILLLIFTHSLLAQSDSKNLFTTKDYLMDDQHSYIGFKIKYFGFSPVRGRFNAFDGHILYDEKDITKTAVQVAVDVNSINTGVEMRDNDLKTSHWFDAERFPKMTFQGEKVVPLENGFQLVGELTIRDITKEIILDFEQPTALSKDFAGNDQVDFSGKVTIKRSDFGIMGSGFWNSLMDGTLQQLADEVEIELDIHCRRPDYLIRKRDLEADNVRKLVLDEFENKGLAAGMKLLQHYKETGTKAARTNISSGALRTIGNVLLAEENTAAALSVFQKKMEWFPESKTGEVDLARVYAAMGNKEQTKVFLKKAIEKDAYNTRAAVLLRLLNQE